MVFVVRVCVWLLCVVCCVLLFVVVPCSLVVGVCWSVRACVRCCWLLHGGVAGCWLLCIVRCALRFVVVVC